MFFLNKETEYRNKVKAVLTKKIESIDSTWASIIKKDIIWFLVILIIYISSAFLLFPTKPEIYIGIGLPLFYLIWKFISNIIDTNRYLERIESANQAIVNINIAKLKSDDEDK